ncbi:MAG: hypothetical protein J6W64_04110 [Bacilli bacterium]|nr:hypothetical protein [Bacilli bacterium]
MAESGNVYVDNTPKELISAYGKSGEAEARVYIYGYVGSDGYLYLKSFAKYRY